MAAGLVDPDPAIARSRLTRTSTVRRSLRWLASGVAGVLIVLIAANIAGLTPIPGGPLGDLTTSEPDAGFEIVTQHQDQPIYTTVLAQDNWPIPVTILSVAALGVGGRPASVTLVGARRFGAADGTILGFQANLPLIWQSYEPIAGITVQPRADAQDAGVAILVRLDPVDDRDIAVAGFVIEYALGPFRFRSTALSAIGSAMLICAADPTPTQFPEFCPPGT